MSRLRGSKEAKSVDELSACLPQFGGSAAAAECEQALNSTDDEFWLSAQPNGYQHTGLFNEWNISSDLSEVIPWRVSTT